MWGANLDAVVVLASIPCRPPLVTVMQHARHRAVACDGELGLARLADAGLNHPDSLLVCDSPSVAV